MKEKETCRTCKFRKRDWTNPYNDSLYCSNEKSLCFGFNTVNANYCGEYSQNDLEAEEKKVRDAICI